MMHFQVMEPSNSRVSANNICSWCHLSNGPTMIDEGYSVAPCLHTELIEILRSNLQSVGVAAWLVVSVKPQLTEKISNRQQVTQQSGKSNHIWHTQLWCSVRQIEAKSHHWSPAGMLFTSTPEINSRDRISTLIPTCNHSIPLHSRSHSLELSPSSPIYWRNFFPPTEKLALYSR